MRRFADPDALAGWIVEALGPEIVTGLPLGIGKATHVANALFARAKADPSLRLEILTALTLERPRASSDLQARMLEPFVSRVFDGYVELDYAKALRGDGLPENVRLSEFFVNSGKWLSNEVVQQHYTSVNYTSVAPDIILKRPINLLAQLVAVDESGPEPRYSLSSNPDITLDVLPELKARREAGEKFLFVGQVNRDLPFMPGGAEMPAEAFDAILDDPSVEFPVFTVPRNPVSTADYVAGLHAASLIRDGGTLQIGIGSLGDAVTYALILRHRHNALFRELLEQITDERRETVPRETGPFEEGLYASSEMFVDGFLDLHDAGILKRRSASGHVLHGAFFAGSRDFLDRLKAMPEARRRDFDMTAVSFTNALYGGEEAKRHNRVHARFLNNAMKVDVLGAAQSDTLGDGRVVSGVGGQHDFVEQALALRGANSVLLIHSHRIKNGKAEPNIVWQLDRTTIPRHMRDVVVTEYGVAWLKGASDAECIARMAAIADHRFADGLADKARKAGKLAKGAALHTGGNRPERLRDLLARPRAEGFFPDFPFGSDFTSAERTALRALSFLKDCGSSKAALVRTLAAGIFARPDADQQAALDRLEIGGGVRDRIYRALLLGAWRRAPQ